MKNDIFEARDPKRVHSFVQIGSYSAEKGRHDSKFRVLRGIPPETLIPKIKAVITELYNGQK